MALLKDAIAEIIDELQTISGIRYAPDELVENSNEQFPFAVVYPLTGLFNTRTSSMLMKGLHEINIELHVARKDLPRDFATVMNLIDEIPYQLMKKRLAGSFSHIDAFDEITYIFGPLLWGGVDTLGVTYTMTVAKVQRAIT
jgi:hypothetical protein